jgi:hypothetical protein
MLCTPALSESLVFRFPVPIKVDRRHGIRVSFAVRTNITAERKSMFAVALAASERLQVFYTSSNNHRHLTGAYLDLFLGE